MNGATDPSEIEEVRLAALGKKGEISLKMRELGRMSPEERQTIGRALNELRDELDAALRARKLSLEDAALEARLAGEWLDVTLPGRPRPQGTIHPISQVTEEVTAIFADMGFAVAEGPQVESDWYNFDALNIAPEHPARQEHDTFFMHRAPGDNRPPHVLRTHTSPVQIRAMQQHGAPVRVIAPGRVYRMDMDQTHTPMFHQIEGVAIDRDISMAQLKWTLEEFCRAFFEVDQVELRFRASHFPFTEPSAEVDIRCSWEGGQLKIGEGNSWLEILGSGMMHPNVLRAGGIDPDQWQGFAFGMGIDRIAMLKYGIPDLRAFFESDLRWLRHYGFAAGDVPSVAGGLSR
ncbi:phenylalanine--tRNA ligase subunit alpha [Paracoccus aerius]